MAESYSVEAYLKATGAKRFASAFKGAASNVDAFKGNVNKTTSVVKDFFKVAGGMYVVNKAFNGLSSAVGGATKRIDTLEQFNRVMSVMVDDSDAVSKAMKRLQGIVEGTSMRTDNMTKAIQNFVTRGMTIDKATDNVEAWGNAVAFYGDGSNEQFANVSDALGKMVAKGKVGMDQLDRVMDAGIPAVEIYADSVGKSSASVQDDLSKGKISAEDFVNTVSDAMMKGTKKFPKISGAMKDMGTSWGSIMENIGAYTEIGVSNIISAIDKMLKNNGLPDMRTMLNNFGKSIGKVLNAVADNIPKIVGFFKGLFESAKPALNKFNGLWGKLKSSIKLFADIAEPIISSFKGSLQTLWESVGPILGQLKQLFGDLWPVIKMVGGIVAAVLVPAWGIMESIFAATISAIGPVIQAFINLADFVVNAVNLIIAILTGDFSGALEYWRKMVQSSVDLFKNLWTGVVNFVKTFVKTIINFFKHLWDVLVGHSIIPDMVKAILKWIEKMVTAGPKLVLSMVKKTLEFFGNLYSKGVQKIKDMGKAVKDKFVNMKNAAVNKAKGLYSGVKNKFASMKNTVSNKVSSAYNSVRDKFSSAKSKAVGYAKGLYTGVRSKFSDMVGAVKDKMGSVKSKIVNGWKKSKSYLAHINLKSIGKDAIQGLINGIKSKITAVKNAVKNVASAITSKVSKILHIGSPSKVLKRIGGWTGEGLAIGIRKTKRMVEKASDVMAQAAIPNLKAIDVGGQIRGINRQARRSLDYEVNNQLSVNKQSANINLTMAGRTYETFVEDITETQDRNARLEENFK